MTYAEYQAKWGVPGVPREPLTAEQYAEALRDYATLPKGIGGVVWDENLSKDENFKALDAAWADAQLDPAKRNALLFWCVHPVRAGETCQATFRDVPPSYVQELSDIMRAQRKAASKAGLRSFWKSVIGLFTGGIEGIATTFAGVYQDDKKLHMQMAAGRAAIAEDAAAEAAFQRELTDLKRIAYAPRAALDKVAGIVKNNSRIFFSVRSRCWCF